MPFTIRFKTNKFDVSKERKNPINPICGHSLLDWLRDVAKDRVSITKPVAEDWGWYSTLECDGRTYLIGASVFYEKGQNPNDKLEWVFQIEKQRSFIEKILEKEKMRNDDSCLLFFKSIFESNSDFKEIEIE